MVVKAVDNTLTILFYPEMPEPDSVVYQLCEYLDFTLSNNPTQSFDIAFKYFDATFFSADLLDILADIRDVVVNAHSLDISKQTMGEIFAEVFGYAIAINPTQATGLGVSKSNINRLRDGQCLTLPIAPAEVKSYLVYQKFIDAEQDGQWLEYGVPIYDAFIPTVLLQSRPSSHATANFSDQFTNIQLVNVNNIFSEQEQQQLVTFAKKLGLDYGELDVLRDRHDGKIYVVDINNTPCEFPQNLTAATKKLLIKKLSDAFVPLIAKRL